ncbi:MFS transporter [Brevundimonas sp. 2R-24]|uniref:MFS transporter n=1 Tax=Peiella sedimenti TaxID=3061083 RepID=A0ABT8SHA9_9CAUL|nr:MFS transporter [Caulobacteraceae bacterium XZ-24]
MKGAGRRAFVILFAVNAIAAAGSTALMSVLPAIGREFGLSDTLISAAFSLSALLWALSAPYWARLSDTRGRKTMILLGLMGFSVSMAAFGLTVTGGLLGLLPVALIFSLMVISRSIHGALGSASPTASQAYVADRTTVKQRTKALSVLASAQGLGTVLGPALAPFFVLPLLGLAGPMYAFAAMGLIVWFATWRGLPSGGVRRKPAGVRTHSKGLWKQPRMRAFVIYGFLAISIQAVNVSVLGFHVIDVMGLPPLEAQTFVSVAMLAGAAATLMAQWGLIPLLHMGPTSLMRWGAGLTIAGNVLTLMSPTYYGVVVGYAVVSLGVGFARPGFMAGASIAVGPHEQGAVAGLMAALAGLCFLAPPVIGVALYEAWDPAPFIANTLMGAAILLMALFTTTLKRAGQAPAPQTPPAGPQPLS